MNLFSLKVEICTKDGNLVCEDKNILSPSDKICSSVLFQSEALIFVQFQVGGEEGCNKLRNSHSALSFET